MSRRILFSIVTLFMASLLCVSISSCDSEDVVLDNYLIGNWHTYMGYVYSSGQKVKVNIEKTGQYALSYIEVTFQKGGKGTSRYWEVDEGGQTRWVEDQFSYVINGDVITMTDSQGESLSLVFDSNKTLSTNFVFSNYGVITTVNIYLKK